MKRKLLAILLACIMTAALLPVPALAEDGQPEESHHEHSYAVTQTAEPTCTEQGYTVYSCACGDTYTDYTDALGYSWDEGKLTLAPTTEAEGEITYTCTACGETRTETLAQLPAEEPTEEAQPDANEETPVIDDIQSVGLQSAPVALTANSEGSTPVMTWADLQAAFNAGGSITLQQGISAGEEDSALTVPSGVEVALDLNGHTIDRRLTSAVASGNVITVNGTLTITDMSSAHTGTITGANNTGSGGAIINKGRLTVSGGTISGNKAQEAGAVLNAAGSVLTISGGTFENNAASTFGGGAIVNHGTVSMSGGLIQNNTAVKNGGGIWSDGTLTVTNGSFANNTAQADGGAVYITGDGSVSEISGGTITGNTADQSAGAVYMIGGTTTISGGTITGNTAKAHGGALYVAGNSTVLNLFGGTITGNTAANQGGAIVKYQDANTINIQGSPVILNNQAAAGPDIYMRNNSGLLNVTGALSADARIGVTLAGGAGTVTFHYGQYNGPGQLACFIPGSSAYAIGVDSTFEIILGTPVTVSFDPGLGTGTMEPVQVANNSYYQLPDCGFTPPHHQEFESWTVNGSSYFPGMYVTISGDTVVKAEYVKHSSYTRVEAVAPTDTVNGSIEYYTCDVCGGYYLYDGSTYTEVTASAIVLPYFTIAANGSEATIQRYNGSDAAIVIPDTVPDNYPDETLRGRDITAVDQSAFENNTVITKVVMGDNIRLIRWHAFYNASNLKEIVIGSGLYTLESDIFKCPALTSFTCTATQPAESPYYPGLEIPQARVFGDCDISNITFYGMHSGAFHYSVWTVGFALDGGKRNYIGLDAHSDPTWTWAADLSSAEAVFACNDCDYAGTQPATVTSEVTTQPTWTTPGVRTYTASVIVTGVTYTDTRTEEIPVLTYTVTVNGGTADKASATAGESVTITANAPGTGKRFKEWTGADGLAFTSGSAATATATFTMPANAVTLTATYEDIYSVTVNGGTTDKASAAEGESVTITANEPEYGKRFKEWTGADGLTFTGGSSAASSTATFTMPGRAVTLAATYETSPTTIVTVEFGEGHGDFAAARFGSVEGFTVTGTTLTYSVVLDSTIGDAKEVFSSKADFYPPAVDDGELFTDDLALNPAGYYASLAEVNAERSAWDGQPVPVEGLKFYAQWEKPVGAVTVSVTAPDPGTEVTVSGNEPMRRTDPQVSVSVTGNVTLDTASGANWWTDYDGTYYSGTVASGQACYARFYLNASYGYYLMYYGAQGPVVADGVSVTVENDSEANISIQSSYIMICAKVIAGQHAVSVANGTADKALAIEGESVTITANAPEAGMRFKEWTGADGLTFTSGGPTDAEATFTMPAADVTVTATYESAAPEFTTQSLILSGQIGLSFNMELPDIEGVNWTESWMTFTIAH
ncbi:MAG: leucine-rich repeat protein, partial [Clostridia bacterium]|nr:leucine-rich repeat protein [Clostridia bacterium]